MADILLEKGRKFRLAFRPSIKKGQWYYGVSCKNCDRAILFLVDNTNGGDAPRFVGEGRISTPCDFCGHDDHYQTQEIKQFQADHDKSSHVDHRPAPSNSPRQPLLKRQSQAVVTFGVGAIEYRPVAAQILARCVAYWTNVECQLARLLAVILKANTEPAIAMYLSLRNARAKTEALTAAAKLTLDESDYELLLALMQCKNSTEKERNDLVHGVFGISNDIPDGLIWMSTTDYTTHLAKVEPLGLTPDQSAFVRKRSFVYEVGDLETIARKIEELNNVIGFFLGYLKSGDPAWRAQRYTQLCNEPLLSIELTRLRLHQKNGKEEPPESPPA